MKAIGFPHKEPNLESMRKVYENLDFTSVGYFQSILEDSGIPTHIKNLGGSGLMGEVPFTEVFPELWVVEDSDYDRAIEILKPHYDTMQESHSDWKCQKCGIQVEGQFGECWKCGAERELPS
ncbi:MAG: DUF2007 domain-containing protein [Verrucomicrobiota bacterium]